VTKSVFDWFLTLLVFQKKDEFTRRIRSFLQSSI
jgi:hypothetical protein